MTVAISMSSGRHEYVHRSVSGDLELQERLQDRREVGAYLRLDDEDLEIDEFDVVLVGQSKIRRRLWYWAKILLLAVVVLIIVGTVVILLGPLLLEDVSKRRINFPCPELLLLDLCDVSMTQYSAMQVVIPILEWEAETFSRPILALVLIASLALFPVLLIPSGPSMWLAGIEFGYGLGLLIIMAGTLFGQSLPFFIGHKLLHNRIRVSLNFILICPPI